MRVRSLCLQALTASLVAVALPIGLGSPAGAQIHHLSGWAGASAAPGKAVTGSDVIVFPDENDRLVQLIASATQTLDIVIYEIGGPLIVGQAGAPGALMEAVARGVKVRVMINGNWAARGTPCLVGAEGSPSLRRACAISQASWAYALRESLMWAYRHPKVGVTPRLPEVHAANNNFQVTHQKTILIDATYPGGARAGDPRAIGDLLPTSRALISTGNLSSEAWGFQGRNPDWLTNPAGSCWGGSEAGTSCQPETGARDFAAVVADPVLVAEVARVYRSDFWCGARPGSSQPSRTNTNGLRTTALPLTWSNGTLQMPPGSRATHYPTALRGYAVPSQGHVQGNVRARTLALISSARTSIRVYNEEMQDPQVVGALIDASRRLGPGKVRVVMSYAPIGTPPQETYAASLAQLTAAGASIVLSQYAGPGHTDANQLYMHAKVFVVDGTDAYLGSTNAGTASMDFNRELGIMLTARPAAAAGSSWAHAPSALARLVATFDRDFADASTVTPWETIAAAAAPVVSNGPGIPSWPQAPWPGTLPILCGALP